MSTTQPQQQSLYRRHRPRSFADVVGQEPVVRTLRNAVERTSVHHAYLFVGSRGTGKTSMAKILAACLNCERGPTVDPCGQCDSCRTIASATSLDVIEMDAASNNSVDDIRELRDSVAYAPVSGRQKVYILDEAHMLSTAAWNAFLKTLEEPPPNTVFVLATTEAQKVPATVVDRCHRFDFHRPTVEQIASVLRRVATAESIDLPPAAVAAVARSATGSFRDALGTLEQLVTYSGAEIALADVLAVLGVADRQLVEDAFDALQQSDARRALLSISACVESGRDAGAFVADLEARARELLVVQTLGEIPSELALTPEADARLLDQAQRVDPVVVVRTLELLAAAMEAIKAGGDQRTQLELALVKAATPEVDSSTRALLTRIERLEHARATGSDSGVARPAAPVANVPPTASTPPAPSPQAESPVSSAPVAEAEHASSASANGHGSNGEAPAAVITAEADSIDSIRALWPAAVELVRAENALLGAVIADAQPVALVDAELTIAFDSSSAFLKKKAEDPNHRAVVSEALLALTGRRLRLEYELRDDIAAQVDAQPKHTEDEWVARFMTEFDAEELPGEPVSDQKGE
ncbi:MAG TPA: DNA polymerase III subunit gamma/tau [Solirubrobacteraceae bacterium]|nr:DNA polymerase III subunit gamma/tau [Solirubrobacteraceae bacterium]